MKIKTYFITYKNNLELNKTLKSFENSGITNYDHKIYIVNNSADIPVVVNTSLKVSIINNETRASFSTGHLSRNWNECLIHGFKNVENPDCDIVILSQNDVSFVPNCIDRLIELHKEYSFIQGGTGDSFHSYTVDAIKKIGLWDERFCNIGCQEADYFIRQKLFNDKCSINDHRHWRVHNPLEKLIEDTMTGWDRSDPHHHASVKYHGISNKVFQLKYGHPNHMHWDEGHEYKLTNGQFIMYPYFEDKFAFNNPNYFNYYGTY